MYEFDTVSVSTYEAAALAAKLSEKSADGWEVVAIVPAGSDITAYVKRASTDTSADATVVAPSAAMASSAAAEPVPAANAAPGVASEPSGWGTAPEASSSGGSSWGQTPAADSGWGSNSGSATPAATGWGSGAASTPTTTAPTSPATPATPAVPAGWYHDPAGRYELRYWDGSAWTEHVSRNGQQYTDPPVA